MYGIVKYPVSDMRSEPKFRSERIHQLVFGEVVLIKDENDNIKQNDYIYACDIRLNYCGYVNKHTLFILDEKEYKDFSKLNEVKISVPFCKSYGAIEYLLPFGSRLYTNSHSDYTEFYLPDGKAYRLTNTPFYKSADPIEIAMQFLGVPYLWGGTSSYGFDCSGFVNRVYDVIDIILPRDANQQEKSLQSVETPKPGDLLFMEGHVMMYIGNNKIIHANGHDMCVNITDLDRENYGSYLKSKIRKIGRITG
ncbi:MAG TPA: C40 family peptidase [Fervidobacterium nodosum]|nr:C40 family peptidase [Fervidobacterium nodosum]